MSDIPQIRHTPVSQSLPIRTDCDEETHAHQDLAKKEPVKIVTCTDSLKSCISIWLFMHAFIWALYTVYTYCLLRIRGHNNVQESKSDRKMIEQNTCRYPITIFANCLSLNNQAHEGQRCGMSTSTVSCTSVSWIQANMTWEGGITTASSMSN